MDTQIHGYMDTWVDEQMESLNQHKQNKIQWVNDDDHFMRVSQDENDETSSQGPSTKYDHFMRVFLGQK